MLLFWVYARQPSADPIVSAKETGKLSPGLFNVSQTLLTTLLGVGLLSLLFEVFLRESFGQDLLRFLNLRTAIVSSGVQHVVSGSEYDWARTLDSASITVLVRNPAEWLIPTLPVLLSVCEKRSAKIRVLVPDKDDDAFDDLAATAGLDRDTLILNINTLVQAAQAQWQSNQPRLRSGSTIEFVTYGSLALHDVVRADNHTVMLIPRAIGQGVGDLPLAIGIEQGTKEYPSSWFVETFRDISTTNAIWAGKVE